MVLHMFHTHYETHFPSRNPTPIQGFHFEVLPHNILSFPKPIWNSNTDLRELTRFRGQVWFGIPGKFLLSFALCGRNVNNPRAQKLRQGIVMKTSFKTQVLRMGLSSFVDIDIFVMKYLFLPILHFSRISQIKIYKMLRPQKGNSRVSLNDTLLNFGLWSRIIPMNRRVIRTKCTL